MSVKQTALTCAAGLLALSCSAGAADKETQPVVVIGAATETILKMQREGSAAGKLQPMSGEEASRAYKRYLESFNRPIPESAQPTGSPIAPVAPASSGSR